MTKRARSDRSGVKTKDGTHRKRDYEKKWSSCKLEQLARMTGRQQHPKNKTRVSGHLVERDSLCVSEAKDEMGGAGRRVGHGKAEDESNRTKKRKGQNRSKVIWLDLTANAERVRPKHPDASSASPAAWCGSTGPRPIACKTARLVVSMTSNNKKKKKTMKKQLKKKWMQPPLTRSERTSFCVTDFEIKKRRSNFFCSVFWIFYWLLWSRSDDEYIGKLYGQTAKNRAKWKREIAHDCER